MRIACCIPKATKTTLSKYVTLSAFPLQQWLYECASLLRYVHAACPVVENIFSDDTNFDVRGQYDIM
jgi:hypothetical protein